MAPTWSDTTARDLFQVWAATGSERAHEALVVLIEAALGRDADASALLERCRARAADAPVEFLAWVERQADGGITPPARRRMRARMAARRSKRPRRAE